MSGSGATRGYYTSQKSKLLKDFDKSNRKSGRKVLESRYGKELANIILNQSHCEFEALIPMIPDVGGKKNLWERNLIGCAWALAMYRALKQHGKTAEEVGKLNYELVEASFASAPRWVLWFIGRIQTSRYGRNKTKKQALKSQQRLYYDDWVFSFLEGNGKDFDYGTDITECAICKFLHAQGADELAMYMCRIDFILSRVFDWGLVRTTTLAEGAKVCDFRYKHGRATKYIWPEPTHP